MKKMLLLTKKLPASLGMVLALAGGLPLSGCISGSDNVDVTLNVVQPAGTITGRLIDGATRQPLANADVTLIVNGAKRTVKSSSSTDPDLAGIFLFSDLPNGQFTLKVAAAGYAVFQTDVQIYNGYNANIGTVILGKTFDLKVVATADGAPVAGATVFAQAYSLAAESCAGYRPTSNTYPYPPSAPPVFGMPGVGPEITAVTDANGTVTLAGLNQCTQYVVTAPAYDANRDGTYDYKTAAVLYDGAVSSDKTLSLPMRPALRDDVIAVVATSMDRNLKVDFNGYNIPLGRYMFGTSSSTHSSGTNATIKVVFNYPVSLSGGLIASYFNNLAETTSLDLTASLDSTGTVLTITPPAGGFPKNRLVTINGLITAQINGITSNFGSLPVYIADDTATGVGPTIALTADNYNGNASFSANAYLEFPEYVSGTFRLISKTSGGVTTALNGADNSINGGMIYTSGTCPSCGTGDGIFYRAYTGEYLIDGDKIKVAIDVVDAEGNRLAKEFELTVE